MTKKPLPLDKAPKPRQAPADDDAPGAESKPLPSLVERVAWRTEQEAIQRGSDEFRARRQMAETLGLEPGTCLTTDPDEASDYSITEHTAWYAEQGTISRGSDELQARRELTEILELDTQAAPIPDEDEGETDTRSSLVERVAWHAEREAIERGSDEFRAQRQMTEPLDPDPET